MRFAVLVGLLLLGAAEVRADGGVLVVAPHPDDEVLAAGGVAYAAASAGADVHVVVVTNGDYYGTGYGLTRQGESVGALGVLGIAEERVVFLGYPDGGLLPLWNNAPAATQAYLSPRSGRTTTYGARGYGGTDLHTVLTGAPGAYNRVTLTQDVMAALELFRPAHVYVTGPLDDHPDHRGTFYAVRDAMQAVAAGDPAFRPVVHTTIVHDPKNHPYDDFWPASAPRELPLLAGNDEVWPNPSRASGVPARFAPTLPFVMPPSLPGTVLDWAAREQVPVPAVMALADAGANLKMRSLAHYASQDATFLNPHVKADEFFWPEPVRVGRFTENVARTATPSVSSAAAGQGAAAAIDGVVDGAPGRPDAEWAASAGGEAALRLAWPTPREIDRIVLFDRVGAADHVVAARIDLDDGTALAVGTLANDGRGDEVALDVPHRVGAVTITITAARGTPGLAEVEIFGGGAGLPCADDTVCGDGDACNGAEVCRAGVCVRDPAPACDDGDPCTRDRCASPGGCVHEPSCVPVPARGRGACRLAFVGLPAAGVCEDGDPACDADLTTDGACRFDAVLCANAGPPTPACELATPLVDVKLRDRREPALSTLVATLRTRLPAATPACVGPVAVRVPARNGPPRAVRLRVRTGGGRALRARALLGCRRAPPGVQRQPPAPLVP
jgi:LmbE family N-acetylglucosaminyl deacetylase